MFYFMFRSQHIFLQVENTVIGPWKVTGPEHQACLAAERALFWLRPHPAPSTGVWRGKGGADGGRERHCHRFTWPEQKARDPVCCWPGDCKVYFCGSSLGWAAACILERQHPNVPTMPLIHRVKPVSKMIKGRVCCVLVVLFLKQTSWAPGTLVLTDLVTKPPTPEGAGLERNSESAGGSPHFCCRGDTQTPSPLSPGLGHPLASLTL